MIEIVEHLAAGGNPADRVITLNFSQRQRSRLRIELGNGETAGLFLPRGTILRDGDGVRAQSGESFYIQAANEEVSTVYSHDPLMLVRASYHLGNRHIALQIGSGWVRYQHDHVLDDMLLSMGLEPQVEDAPFEPEAGAYHSHSHDHGHNHAPDHEL